MKSRFKVVIVLVSFVILMAACSENNVLSPTIKEKIVEKEVLTYVDYTSFGDIIGSWKDVDWGGIWIISSNSYYDNGGGWYELYGEIVEKELTKNYFIIMITNHSTDSNQEGKYTKVHIKDYRKRSINPIFT